MARVLKANGSTHEELPQKGQVWRLSQLQEWVGGYIELVYQDDYGIVYANEEGLLQGLPLNKEATALFGKSLVGDVVYLEHGEYD